MTEDQATISSRCRDEKMAKKMNLPFSTWEVINSPVDTFSEMLARPGLTSEQVKLCRAIRRRGKNKVAAQNCRKRKLDTIEELQSQVGQVQRRKAQLLRTAGSGSSTQSKNCKAKLDRCNVEKRSCSASASSWRPSARGGAASSPTSKRPCWPALARALACSPWR